ncbi:MAG TPA: hypothetical protein VMG08_03880 [Allosphingosinicella sp.]|nr:hypothetical protein [Allosphingosinicella sp.]
MKKSLFCIALLMSGAASAQPGSGNASPNGAGASGNDPNQMICRSIRETGSMLSRSRVCKTRAQWEEERRQTRQNIDRSQTNRMGPDNQ